ncbi:hypothetical protein LL033_26130 (plasmid) [Clostridium estertheticum]|uniref:hypothetical protein n=1 Tax=Clostridium estertheticum TaxID=238834 RepID=UPI001C0C110B|nr:hypothetical protein [Clostridium estertheticum]MBU3218271.1 hypothetical protein [Clostridium estertheticum]WAG58231.1 hypothetical protein LL033_26130 [Clostridium estertheticum]
MKQITTIIYDNETFKVFYVQRFKTDIVDDYGVARPSLINRIIYVYNEFLGLSENSKKFMLLHEIGHIIGITDNIEADIFALKNTSLKIAENALHETRNVFFKLKPLEHEKILNYINLRINILKNK